MNTVLVAHNIRFDGAILRWRFNMLPPHAYMDTVGLAKAVIGGNVSSYSLKRLAEYLGLPAKGELSCDGVLNPTAEQLAALGEYCCNDVNLCGGIYDKLIGQFPISQLWSIDWTIRTFLEPRLRLSEAVLEKGVQEEKLRRETVIKASGIEKTVLSSDKQFAQLLMERGVAVRTKVSPRTGKAIPAFAKTDTGLDALRNSHPELYAARIASKASLLETRGESLLAVAKTGAFPFDVGFSGAVQTHRYSGGSGAGGNPQNFTRGSFLRSAVCAPDGQSLVVGDFAAIEARLVAWLAKEPRLMSAFVKDVDVYSDFASVVYGRPINKKDHPTERFFGKEGILGLGYGMGAKKFQARIKTVLKKDITEDEAWRTVDLYRTTYFNVPKLWEQANAILPLISTGSVGCMWFAPFIKVRKNAVILPSGLAIQYPNLRHGWYMDKKANKKREGWHYDAFFKTYEAEPVGIYGGMVIENVCQALAGELCKDAIERAERSGIQCVGQIHDEIIAVSPSETAQTTTKALKDVMERSPSWLPSLRLKSEVGYGQDWNTSKV
jgi:DNA polymerase